MLTNLLDRFNFLPKYDATRVRVEPPKPKIVEKFDTKAALKQFDQRQPEGVKMNAVTGNLEKRTDTKDGVEFEVIQKSAYANTEKTVTQKRVTYLTDADKIEVVKANLDGVKAELVKKHWGQIQPNGKYLNNAQIAQRIKMQGLGERNIATYAAAFSKAMIALTV